MNMHAMNMQLTVVVGADWTLHPWRHNSSNVRGVTAGQVGHNSSIINSNNIGATTARCVYGSGAWTGRNLILDEGLPTNTINTVELSSAVCE